MVDLDIALAKVLKWSPFLKPEIDVPADFKGTHNFCDMKKRVGIEIEVEKVRKSVGIDPNFWGVTEDGSLRNHGLEFISRALQGREIEYALMNLFTSLPSTVDFSERTSQHVHVNARDLTTGQLLTIILLYITFEKLLYQFAGPARADNIFCIPIKDTRYPYIISDFFINGNVHDVIRSWRKYSGMNLKSLIKLGTIEYRIMEGQNDPHKLMIWINILLRMHNYARRNTFENVYRNIQMLNTNSMYEHFVQNVFHAEADILLHGDIKMLLESGVSTAKCLSMPSSFMMTLVNDMKNNSNLLTSLGVTVAQKRIYNNPMPQSAEYTKLKMAIDQYHSRVGNST